MVALANPGPRDLSCCCIPQRVLLYESFGRNGEHHVFPGLHACNSRTSTGWLSVMQGRSAMPSEMTCGGASAQHWLQPPVKQLLRPAEGPAKTNLNLLHAGTSFTDISGLQKSRQQLRHALSCTAAAAACLTAAVT